MTEKYEDLFDKPLSEYTDEELLEMANAIRTERRYPSVTKAKNKKVDAVDKLVNQFVIKEAVNEKDSNSNKSSK